MDEKETTKLIKLYVVKKVGYDLPGYGWQPYGGHFDVSESIGQTLARAAPQIFSLSPPPKLEAVVPQEPSKED